MLTKFLIQSLFYNALILHLL